MQTPSLLGYEESVSTKNSATREMTKRKRSNDKAIIISIEFTNNAQSVGKGELDESIYLTRNPEITEENRQL